MPTGSATARARPIESTVSRSVVGIRSMTSRKAGARWKKELPKSPVSARPKNRPNCTGRGSCKPRACRSTARSASGASGMMSDTGSPLACRIANVTSETPTHTTARRASRRTRNWVIAAAQPRSALRLGVEEPEPLVAAGGVLDALVDGQRVVLREQEDGRRLLADEVLDLRVDPLAARLIHRRARLVDELVESFHARVVLADPAARLGVEQRVEHGVGIEHRVVAPGAVGGVGGLALGLEELVPGRARVPHPGVGPEADLGEHLGDRLEDGAELDEGAVGGDVHAVRIAGRGQQLLGLLGIVGVGLDLAVEAERFRLHDGGHLLAEAAHELADDGLAVDRVVGGLARQLLV